jgi:two-component system, chemotaxis family, protein-glutamate methylesterase/glutaminase
MNKTDDTKITAAKTTNTKTKVVIVDDSALIRAILTEIINDTNDLEVVGVAKNAFAARDLIRELNPDVITLDIEMPDMDGLEFLEKLMRLRPMPVLMVSTLTQAGANETFRALELGAVDYIAKPKVDIKNQLQEYADEITAKIRIVASAKIMPRKVKLSSAKSAKKPLTQAKINTQTPPKTPIPPAKNSIAQIAAKSTFNHLLVIGASTGGTEAIKDILLEMPANSPPILIVQHMPEGFTTSYAARLDSLCAVQVREAKHAERILPGNAYLAPGGYHLSAVKSGSNYICQVTEDEAVNRHRPSVDVLFESVAQLMTTKSSKLKITAVILTGMGKDGAIGMKLLHDKGATTFAQDEASCVVFGMPKEAISLGGVDRILPLDAIATHVLVHLNLPE